MRKNPLAELLGRLLRGIDDAADGLEVDLEHRGAPDGIRTLFASEIVAAGGRSITLRDGTEIPLHRVIELRSAGRVVWRRAARP